MKVSLSWLREYVTVDINVNDLADALTMVGLEVEAVSDRYDYLGSVVIGRITEISPHPNADKLKICSVDIGNSTIPVVCGAPNAKKDILAPCALPGTYLPKGIIVELEVMIEDLNKTIAESKKSFFEKFIDFIKIDLKWIIGLISGIIACIGVYQTKRFVGFKKIGGR